MEFGKACEDLSWNHCTSTPHRSETGDIAERAVRGVKEGTSAVLLQPCLNQKWGVNSMECYTHVRNIQDLLSVWKTQHERRFGDLLKGKISPFGSLVEYYLFLRKTSQLESLSWIILQIRIVRGWNLEGWHKGCRLWGIGNGGWILNVLYKSHANWTGFTQFTLLDEKAPDGYTYDFWNIHGWIDLSDHSIQSIGRETLRRKYVVWVDTDEKATDIQIRYLMSRRLDEIGRKSKAEGEVKLVKWKSKTR